ncbi:hypothetical protein PHJA_000479900 [Phtheirospermum japonicum]|uniref:Uncharacterized protein n=1 Tax=Phtheirospermum japonicum TaxID=374723 RepID=A0A830BHK0_9LAMI|nr:hypothetical protein PHJA_000479900 [Phtheirospermum japonicum]
MSTFDLSKKLKPARKVWKSLKNNLRSKLNHSIKTFRQRFNVASKSISPVLTKRSPPHHYLRCGPINSAIYVDELFPGPVSLAEPGKAEENMDERFPGPVKKPGPMSGLETRNKVSVEIPGNREKGLGEGKAEAGESSKSSSPEHFRCINERAEEFIAKFRQDMKLEREQSIHEFEEMLKRSA